MASRECDLLILGGGLAGGLIALALAERRPELDVLLVEQDQRLGGNHVWSFFGSDVAKPDRWLLERLVVKGWKGYDVAFPGHARTLPTTYYSVTSERFDHELRQTLPPRAILTGARVLSVGSDHALLADGSRIDAKAVIDARGAKLAGELTGGWQKFAGRMIETTRPHGLERPLVMDATVDQRDGFRFVYALPFGERQVFVEDTYYSDNDRLDRAALKARVDAWVKARGWRVKRVLGEEHGVLPVVSGGDFAAFWRATGSDTAKAGTRAGLFHPLTSYSLPDAVRFAVALAARRDVSAEGLRRFSEEQGRAAWKRGSHSRRLAAMLFGAAAPIERYKLLERFYRLDSKLIERFYAGRSTRMDKLRMVAGRPPVPVGRALAALSGLGERTRLRHAALRADAA
ncbi:MAG TPA: lycopene beta-cyclase CrtY [Novosphingobium sp.]|nr:lycopene beta-cyclase CrtY [Novosphingobium sp.]